MLFFFSLKIFFAVRIDKINSENQVVSRSVKAIGLIYHLTRRAPALISQSHLEKSEGKYRNIHPPKCIKIVIEF